ncbi:aspartyl protease family protein [Luteimonas sp. S4-F44]|uniref:aspartyl protease family protein n=1 Tax=Luteimonas sp. S4-F44 TaxID=2925842 RepID=UPI001F52F489|nr:aspartyl protease family protein [Luteimonas sp. S4-F44]UNK42411.1 aspartyl protease family protein [Luteimonas sp. S4-F44]
MSLRVLLSACLLSLTLGAPCAAVASPPTSEDGAHRIAMDLVGKHPRVEVRIEGVERPLSFVVDTAAGASVVDLALAERFELLAATSREMTIQGAGGSAAATRVTALQALSAGDFAWKAQLLAMDLSQIAEGDAPPVEGILGNDLMARFDLRFDLPAGELVLAPAGSLPRAACLDNALPQRAAGLQRFAFVPAQLRDGPHEAQATAVVDTGAAQTVLNLPAARALGVTEDDARLRRRDAGTRGIAEQVVETWLHTLPALAIGDWQLAATEVRISALPVFSVLGLAERPAVILGIDALRHRRVDVLANAAGVCLGPATTANGR